MRKRILTFSAMGVLLTSAALYGCDSREQPSATLPDSDQMAQRPLPKFEGVQGDGQTVRPAPTPAPGAAPQADGPSIADRARDTASEVGDRARAAANDVGDKVSDAVITATVKAELAKDDQLSALDINVDTEDGRVALRGTAPTPAARDRATGLAAAVEGVVSVENQLTIATGRS